MIQATARAGTFVCVFEERALRALSFPRSFDSRPGADWPSGEPGEFPVACQPIWPAALHLFLFFFVFFYNLLLLFYNVVVVFVAYRM